MPDVPVADGAQPGHRAKAGLEFLAHGIDPVNCWAAYTDPDKPESGDARMEKFLAAGLQKFDMPRDWVNRPKLLLDLPLMRQTSGPNTKVLAGINPFQI